MTSAAPTMDTLGPFFHPLLRSSKRLAAPILGSYNRSIGTSNTSLTNAILAVCLAVAMRSCRTVYAWSRTRKAQDKASKTQNNTKGKGKTNGKITANGKIKAAMQGEDEDLKAVEEEGEAVIALGVLHACFNAILFLAATRSAPLRGAEGDEARSLALLTALVCSAWQGLQWLMDEEPAPVAIAATTHCLGLTLALFPLGGAARHLKYAAALAAASPRLQETYDGLLPLTTGMYVGRSLLILAGFLLVVALTLIGLSLGRWEQFRRFEFQLAAAILAVDMVALTLIEFR